MMGGGPPMGSPFGGPSATESSAAAGLPFAGMPSELAERAERILEHEPAHPEPDITFDPVFRPQRLTITSLVTPHTGAVFVAVALLVAETVTMLAGPALTQVGIDRGVQPADKGALVVTVLLFVFAVAANTVLTRSRLRVTGALGERLMLGLRVRVFSHLQRLSMDFYTDSKSGVLLSRMTSDIESLSVLLQEGFVNLMVQALTLLFVTLVLFYYNATLALVVIVVVVPPLLALTLWFRSASSRGYDAIRDRVAEVLADLSENLAGIRVVVSSNRQARNSAEHRHVVGRYRDANLVTARAGAIYGPASEGIGLVAQAIVLLVGGRMVLRGDLALGELAAFVLYVTTFFAPIQQLVQLYNTYQQGQAAIRKLDGLLAEEPLVEERPGAPELPRIEGRIELRGVTFSYRPGQPVLHDLDLVIEAGETFALVGDTGAGKSTVARLISRFHDPDDGTVLIDGHDLTTVTIHSIRSQLGVVPQEPYLFDGTIKDNLAFARPDATDEELDETVRLVGLDDLVDRLPDGIDTVVHERGSTLSAGERQLLALGRAFLARPRVVVLDEATSSLDLASEAKVERALDTLVQGRTAVLIAHRLSTARKADRIAVVRDGRLVETGHHDELVGSGGWYSQAWARWERSGHATSPAAELPTAVAGG